MPKCKISVVCESSEVPTLVSRLTGYNFVVTQVQEKVVGKAPTWDQVERYGGDRSDLFKRPSRPPQTRAGALPDKQGPGRVIMEIFKTVPVIRGVDCIEPLNKAGYVGSGFYNHLRALVICGAIVRAGQGVYRLPTTDDNIRFNKTRVAQPSPA